MEIGVIYSSKDPRQTQARDFVMRFVQEHGILARIVESEQPVKPWSAPAPLNQRRTGWPPISPPPGKSPAPSKRASGAFRR